MKVTADSQASARYAAPSSYRGHPVVELADDEEPRQRPNLTEREAAQAYADAWHRALEWLMVGDEPDPRAFLVQLFDRPAWHALAACWEWGPLRSFRGTVGPPKLPGRSARAARSVGCSAAWPARCRGLGAEARAGVLRRGAAFSDIFDQINAYADGRPINVVNPGVLAHARS